MPAVNYGSRRIILLALALTAGCAEIQPVITSSGYVDRVGSFQFEQFKSSFERAHQFALNVASAVRRSDDRDVQDAYTQMVMDGHAFADASCADFFRSAGLNQQWSHVARDLVGAVGTLATALSAAGSASSGVTVGLGIGTATAYNTLDIYQRNFLFGAENIDSVRTLIDRALSAHTAAALEAARRQPWTSFGDAAHSIMDHQAICMPASILLLTRTAIRNADVETVPTAGRNVAVTVRQAASTGLRGPVVSGSLAPGARQPVIIGQESVQGLPRDVTDRRNRLQFYVRQVAARTLPADLPSSELRRIAQAIGAPLSDDVGSQSVRIVAFIQASLQGRTSEQARAELDSISAKLAEAGITQRF